MYIRILLEILLPSFCKWKILLSLDLMSKGDPGGADEILVLDWEEVKSLCNLVVIDMEIYA